METIVGFYTQDSIYSKEADRLKASADNLGLKIDLKPIESTGEWVKNASKKAGILVEFRKNIRGPLLYLDVDAFVHKNPWEALNQITEDISCYITPEKELLSGTILIKDSVEALELLEKWNSQCLSDPTVWDQRVLQDLVDQPKKSFSFGILPHSFCYIFDSENKLETKDVYIEHLQASRELKKKRKWTGFFTSRFYRRQNRLKEIEALMIKK